jgi:ATP-dependent phosphoenolpyruvate carboxykinase
METPNIQLTSLQIEALKKENEELRELLTEGQKVVTQGKPVFDLIGDIRKADAIRLTLKLPKIIYAVQRDDKLIENVIVFLDKITKYDNTRKY